VITTDKETLCARLIHTASLQDLGVQFTDDDIQTALEEIDAGRVP
jgi:hypothetical protein